MGLGFRRSFRAGIAAAALVLTACAGDSAAPGVQTLSNEALDPISRLANLSDDILAIGRHADEEQKYVVAANELATQIGQLPNLVIQALRGEIAMATLGSRFDEGVRAAEAALAAMKRQYDCCLAKPPTLKDPGLRRLYDAIATEYPLHLDTMRNMLTQAKGLTDAARRGDYDQVRRVVVLSLTGFQDTVSMIDRTYRARQSAVGDAKSGYWLLEARIEESRILRPYIAQVIDRLDRPSTAPYVDSQTVALFRSKHAEALQRARRLYDEDRAKTPHNGPADLEALLKRLDQNVAATISLEQRMGERLATLGAQSTATASRPIFQEVQQLEKRRDELATEGERIGRELAEMIKRFMRVTA